MKSFNKMVLIGALSALVLSGCGSGGGGTAVAPVTRALTTVYLFGNMSTNATVTSLQTSMTLPAGVMVNYTSPAGASAGTWPLRSSVITPSGPNKVSMVSGSFDMASRKLEISLVNGGFLNLSSSTVKNGAKGTELATLNFTLATPGVTPAMPTQDASPVVGKQTPGPTVGFQNGFKTNFSTLFR